MTPPASTNPNAPTSAGTEFDPLERERSMFEQAVADEAAAVAGLAGAIGPEWHEAVALIERCSASGGTVLVSGLGKSGLVGAKISATLASLGSPSHAVHPSEAAHGDLGRFRPTDTAICISHSGETGEVVNLAAVLRQDGLPIISITGEARPAAIDQGSSLCRLATVALCLNVPHEAAGASAPTSSTTAAMALGDALALAVAARRRFSDADFARRHPGGALGGLLRPVRDVLRFEIGVNTPALPDSTKVEDALRQAESVRRRPGALMLVDKAGKLSGIFTDGDLRRLVLAGPESLARPIAEVMTRSPRSLPETALVRDAVLVVREHRQDEIPVIDQDGRPVGLLDVQDLIAMRLVRE
ncbi:MAG: KpsF/GutQ family sugar-phosphate isomerase [Planctomycetota bacterium]